MTRQQALPVCFVAQPLLIYKQRHPPYVILRHQTVSPEIDHDTAQTGHTATVH